MAGNALTTMFVFSGLTCGAPPPDPPEHPAASIVTAAADAMSTLRDFIVAPSEIAASHATRDRLGSTARQHCQAAATDCVTIDHNVPHRPSHAKRYDLSGSDSTLLPILTQRTDHGHMQSAGTDPADLGQCAAVAVTCARLPRPRLPGWPGV